VGSSLEERSWLHFGHTTCNHVGYERRSLGHLLRDEREGRNKKDEAFKYAVSPSQRALFRSSSLYSRCSLDVHERSCRRRVAHSRVEHATWASSHLPLARTRRPDHDPSDSTPPAVEVIAMTSPAMTGATLGGNGERWPARRTKNEDRRRVRRLSAMGGGMGHEGHEGHAGP
jgi:hypothetical protein